MTVAKKNRSKTVEKNGTFYKRPKKNQPNSVG